MCPAPVRGNKEFPSPTPDDAVSVAVEVFEAGERIDMARIAARIGVGRSTLYRWVGDRDALIERVMDDASVKLAVASRRRIRGKGLDRVLSAVRVYLEATANYEPLRQLARREPEVALHVIMNPGGRFASTTLAGLRQRLATDLPEAQIPDAVLDVINSTNLAVVWASIAGGFDPGIDRAVQLLRLVLTPHLDADQRS